MLLNNFKPLLFFGGGGTFKDVTGTTVNVEDAISGGDNFNIANGHQWLGTNRSFNYSTTVGSNSYTAEQTAYTWKGVVDLGADDGGIHNNGFTIFVGTGNAAVTANDYSLNTPVTLDVTAASCTTNANGIVTTTRTFENNTGSSVTIREIGLYIFRQHTEYSGSLIPVVMIGRKVLDTPVTISVGEQRVFEYIVDMNHINFSSADS